VWPGRTGGIGSPRYVSGILRLRRVYYSDFGLSSEVVDVEGQDVSDPVFKHQAMIRASCTCRPGAECEVTRSFQRL